MLRRIVEQHNAPGLDFTRHPLGDIRRGQVFPVQAVTAGSSCKGRQQLPSMQMDEGLYPLLSGVWLYKNSNQTRFYCYWLPVCRCIAFD